MIDFAAWPARLDSVRAGLLLVIPDLVNLNLPAPAATAGYPGTRVTPAVSWLLSMLALKLTRTRRVSRVDDLLADPAAALLAGLAVLPKKSALTGYAYRLSHDHQHPFLAALDAQMIASGLATAGEAIFDLDGHALGPGPGAGKALRAQALPAGPQRAHLLRPRQRHLQRDLRQRRHLQGHPGPRGARVLRPLEGRQRPRPGPCWSWTRRSPPSRCSANSTPAA